MILINCTGHSGFTVESENYMLIFDYSEGILPPIPQNKKLYVFVSHAHEDHFNPDIFSICRDHPSVKFVISYDIPRDVVESCGVTDYICAEPGMDIRPESRFRIKVLPSTDEGVAYLAGWPGRNIFHAGDLNLCLLPGVLLMQKRGWVRATCFSFFLGTLLSALVAGAFLLLPYSEYNWITWTYTLVPGLIALVLLWFACRKNSKEH